MKNGNLILKMMGIIAFAAVVVLAIYCMVNGLGLVEGLDFGAGAYYYADIPQFAKYVNGDHFISKYPMWVHILLFLIWGAAMFKLWIWLDRKWN